MTKHIQRCTSCQEYTMKEECSKCKIKTILPKPPKFSLNDKYAHLRREVKNKELKEKGLY